MKILNILVTKVAANGIWTVVTELAERQIELGHEVRICNLMSQSDAHSEQVPEVSLKNLTNYIENERPDIVIFHSIYYFKYLKIARFLRKQKIPYLIELHGALSKENYQKGKYKKWLANLLFYRKFIKKSAGIIYLNEEEFSHSLVRTMHPSKIIIPNGCNAFDTKRIESVDTKFRVLYIGRIAIKHKGLDVLLEGIKALGKYHEACDIKFDFYGTGHAEDIRIFEEGISQVRNLAEYHGAVYGKDKEIVFDSHDILILTSRFEGMPMVVLEALSRGLPCLVTPNTNMAKIVTENNCGWVTELDKDEICKTILKAKHEMLHNSAQYRERALSTSKMYTWDNIAKIAIEEYQQVVDEVTTK